MSKCNHLSLFSSYIKLSKNNPAVIAPPYLVLAILQISAISDLIVFLKNLLNGKVVASMQRQAEKGEFRANIHQGGIASIIKITPEEKKLALKAAKVLNLAVAGVDIIRSNKGPLLLEVNSSPGLEGIENATGKDIANAMIMAIEKRLKFQ